MKKKINKQKKEEKRRGAGIKKGDVADFLGLKYYKKCLEDENVFIKDLTLFEIKN